LDDYESGTWTPTTVTDGFSTSISSYTNATYTKVGNLVTVKATINLSGVGYNSSATRIAGLPFSVADKAVGAYTSGSISSGGRGSNLLALTGTSQIYLHIAPTTIGTTEWYFSFTYEV
jgi:hypothetical protein